MRNNGIFGLLLHVIFPQSCPACGRLATAYCEECLEKAAAQALPPFCAECGGPYGPECCTGSVPCYAASIHDGVARSFILSLKYRNMRVLGKAMGRRMAEIFPQIAADVLTPVPLRKWGGRAYNQTELLARGIGMIWDIDVDGKILQWNMNKSPQTSKGAAERRMLPLNSFRVVSSVQGKRVILVDDVYTTGATVRAAIHALRRAGADVSAVLVWSRRVMAHGDSGAWPENAEFWP